MTDKELIEYLRLSPHSDAEETLMQRLEAAGDAIENWKAVAAGYCEQLSDAKQQIAKMEAAGSSLTNLMQGQITLLDSKKDAEIDRLKVDWLLPLDEAIASFERWEDGQTNRTDYNSGHKDAVAEATERLRDYRAKWASDTFIRAEAK